MPYTECPTPYSRKFCSRCLTWNGSKRFRQDKNFLKTIGPFLPDKNTVFSQISIEKNNRIISDDSDLSEQFSTFIEDAVRSLNVEPDEYYLSDTGSLRNRVEIVIKKFENQPSVQAFKQNISVNKDFYFSITDVSDILKETTALNNKKNGTFGNNPTKLLKEVSDICSPALNDIWNNEIITQKCFPNNLKLADVTPVFKKEDASSLKNYRPVSVLLVVSKIYERIMQKHILEYIEEHLSPHSTYVDIEKGTVHRRLQCPCLKNGNYP